MLVLEDKIGIRFWLQPIGRMPPLLLHFPIVILFLAMVLKCFSGSKPIDIPVMLILEIAGLDKTSLSSKRH